MRLSHLNIVILQNIRFFVLNILGIGNTFRKLFIEKQCKNQENDTYQTPNKKKRWQQLSLGI